jgi:chromosome segregation ATPase
LIRSSSEAADLRARLELTERTESSLREDLERVREERQRHQEEADRLRTELEAERSKDLWRRLFGG